jgi:beta-glucosidase/6-phospho-beta-glucosidase/beta-galactosidase
MECATAPLPDLRLCHALTAIQRLTSSGVDIRGYLHWSLVDNFACAYGGSARFGLFRLARETLARTPTAGAEHYRELIASQRRAHRDGR